MRCNGSAEAHKYHILPPFLTDLIPIRLYHTTSRKIRVINLLIDVERYFSKVERDDAKTSSHDFSLQLSLTHVLKYSLWGSLPLNKFLKKTCHHTARRHPQTTLFGCSTPSSDGSRYYIRSRLSSPWRFCNFHCVFSDRLFNLAGNYYCCKRKSHALGRTHLLNHGEKLQQQQR